MASHSYEQRASDSYPSGVNTRPGKPRSRSNRFGIRTEERIGSLIAAAGVVWFVYLTTSDFTSLFRFDVLPAGPLELCGLGILTWLHGKYRRSINLI